jgi:L-threonylcarbamoyladenylate synthase
MTAKVLCGEKIEQVAEAAAGVIKRGGLVVFPTETSYGLGADAFNVSALERIALVKEQPEQKAISVIVASLGQAREIGKIDEKTEQLMKEFMPGPLTLVVEKQENVPAELSAEGIAFRISSNKIANAIAEKFGKAITATSANLHGKPAIYSGKEAVSVFGKKVDLVIDSGELERQEASTIFDVHSGKVLREGKITKKEIKRVLEKQKEF